LSLCTTAHPLYTIFTKIIGASISEATMRPNPRRGARERGGARGSRQRLRTATASEAGRAPVLRATRLAEEAWLRSVALSLCVTAHPFHTTFTNSFGASISEPAMQRNPRRHCARPSTWTTSMSSAGRPSTAPRPASTRCAAVGDTGILAENDSDDRKITL
jgi:hypothetical protein